MVGVIAGIEPNVELRHVELHRLGVSSFVIDDRAHRRYEVLPARIDRRLVDRRHDGDLGLGEPGQRLEAGARKSGAGRIAVRQSEEIRDGAAIAVAKDRVPVQPKVRGDLFDRLFARIGHEADRDVGSAFAGHVIGVLAAAVSQSGAVVAGGDVDEHGPGPGVGDVLERRRIHEQLPVVFMGGENRRRRAPAAPARWRRQARSTARIP